MKVQVLGEVSYEKAWEYQHRCLMARIKGEAQNTLLIVEHPHTITIGRKFSHRKELEQETTWKGLPLFLVERGGGATYHGPGQVILYPIFQLSSRLGPKKFLRLLERVVVQTLSAFSIESYSLENATGVWVGDQKGQLRKIASIGIAVRRWVSYHGLALNVSTELSYFQKIIPCGFDPSVMINMRELLGGHTPSQGEVETVLKNSLSSLFSEL